MTIDMKIWNVESTCDGVHDYQIYYTLSFVTPTVEDPEGLEGKIIPAEWHLPYKINFNQTNIWKLVYLDYDDNLQVVDITTSHISKNEAPSDIDKIQGIFETKLKEAIQFQIKPYSSDSLIASRQETGKSTLPHELAGLNQLPKLLSEFLFNATVTVRFSNNQIDGLILKKIIGLYPAEFEISGEKFTFVIPKKQDIKNNILDITYNAVDSTGAQAIPLIFKDIVQLDPDNKPDTAPNSFDGSSLVYLNDPSVSGRLDILASNMNAFRILSDSIKKFTQDNPNENPTLSLDSIKKFIYGLLLKGVLRKVENSQQSFTIFDPSFANDFGLDAAALNELKKHVVNNELAEIAGNWFDKNNKLNSNWAKLEQKISLSNLADFLGLLANEYTKEIKESTLWVDWLYFVYEQYCEEKSTIKDQKIKSLITTRLQDTAVRNRLLLRPFFTKVQTEIFKTKLLNCKDKPTSDQLKSDFKPLVDLMLISDIKGLSPYIETEILQSLVNTTNQIYDQSSALPDDWGISIKIEDINSKNKDIRGYSIALCSVEPNHKQSILESVWLTNRHVLWQENLRKNFLEFNGSKLIVDRPHGGFKSQGEQVLSINYYGDGTGLSESDRSNNLNTAIRFVSLDVDEKEENKIGQSIYPKLGYGMYYRSAVTSILNSGLVVEKSFRHSKQEIGIYTLRKSSEITYQEEPKQYLCRVKPAAPNIVSLENGCNINEDDDLSRDSLALLVYKNEFKNTHTNPPVYLLSQTDNKFWNKKTESLELTIDRPSTSYNVFERWINTELVYVQKGVLDKYKDPYFKEKTVENLIDLLAKFPRMSSDEKYTPQPPHPAVRAIGIKIFDVTSAQKTEVASNQITIKNYDDYLNKEKKSILKVKATYTSSSKVVVNCDNDVLDISLAPKKIYRICLYSLVPKNLCSGDFVRVQEEILKSETDKTLVGWGDYYQGAESEFWIECLAAETEVNEAVLDSLFGKASVKPTSSLVSLNVDKLDSYLARLFSGLEFEQHRWRWTGYPSEIDIVKDDGSQDEQLNLRLMDYWGARSRYYEIIEKDAKNQNQLDGHWQISIENNQFIVNPQKLHDWHFKGHHGAHHGVYLLKPRLRYQSLIEENQLRTIKSIINKTCYQHKNVRPFLVNAVLPIHDESFKLPPLEIAYSAPVLEWDKTSSDNNRLVHAGSGVMCVFDEVFYRNDDMGLFGGLAERYEISLVPTRIKGLNQIGPDPVFHPQPNVKKFTKNDKELSAELNLPYLTNNIPVDDLLNQLNWKVENTRFYGLTKDGGINHKNNQTATILYLTGNFTHQYDILAQVRTRRWLEPTLVEGAEIKPDNTNDNTKLFLPKRFVKQDWVPIDYCIFFDGKNKRELVSWHKGNWNNTSEEIWRRNIIIQELKPNFSKWETIDEKTPYEDNLEYKGQSDANHFELEITYHPITSPIKVFKWITSDYSDGTWMTFLGAPWRNQSLASRPFGLLFKNNELKVMRQSLNFDGKKLASNTELIAEDLIIHPLVDLENKDKKYVLGSNESFLKNEKHRFNILFVYETFKPEDQADSDEKYCKLHSLWHPIRNMNIDVNAPSLLKFVPIINNTVKLSKNNSYIGALYEFYAENINDDVTKAIKEFMLSSSNSDDAIERLNKLWFPSDPNNFVRPLVIMRPPMMSYMPISFDETKLSKMLSENSKIDTGEVLKLQVYTKNGKPYFKLYINKGESFWEIYENKGFNLDCFKKYAQRGSITTNGLDNYCLVPNGNVVIKLTDKSNDQFEVITAEDWSVKWLIKKFN